MPILFIGTSSVHHYIGFHCICSTTSVDTKPDGETEHLIWKNLLQGNVQQSVGCVCAICRSEDVTSWRADRDWRKGKRNQASTGILQLAHHFNDGPSFKCFVY